MTVQDIVKSVETADERLLLELIERYRTNIAGKYAEKEYLLERDGVGFSPRGNVMAISAEKKAGKTWFSMALCAALLSGQYLGMASRCTAAKVLFFDTEQDEGDGQRILRRVHYACRWDFETNYDQFKLFHLRELDASARLDFVVKCIAFLKPDFVVIDGLRDLLRDFNDLGESAGLISALMQLSSQYNCAIWTVLHVNPNSDKMRGHLGTELGNKVADIIHMTKDKDKKDEDIVTYKAEETAARGHKDIKSIVFRINDDKPYGMPECLDDATVGKMEADKRSELSAAIMAVNIRSNGISWTALQKALRDAGYGRNESQRMIMDAVALEILTKADNGRYYYHSGGVEQSNMTFDEPNGEYPF